MKVEEPGENNIHHNAFYAEETLLKSESEAMRDCNPLTARHWVVSLLIIFTTNFWLRFSNLLLCQAVEILFAAKFLFVIFEKL